MKPPLSKWSRKAFENLQYPIFRDHLPSYFLPKNCTQIYCPKNALWSPLWKKSTIVSEDLRYPIFWDHHTFSSKETKKDKNNQKGTDVATMSYEVFPGRRAGHKVFRKSLISYLDIICVLLPSHSLPKKFLFNLTTEDELWSPPWKRSTKDLENLRYPIFWDHLCSPFLPEDAFFLAKKCIV